MIRPATEGDRDAIRAVHRAAFPTSLEADLVDRLIDAGQDELSLVAEQDGQVVGHVLFSRVTIERDGTIVGEGLGLAPLAVSPAHQKRGIGSQLVAAGLSALEAAGCPLVVVLGEPAFYGRFGFETASRHGLMNEYGVDEHFMVAELFPDALPAGGGLVRYGEAFASLGTPE